MTKLGGWVGYVTRTSQFDFGSGLDPDTTFQWDTRHKLFNLVEVCTLHVPFWLLQEIKRSVTSKYHKTPHLPCSRSMIYYFTSCYCRDFLWHRPDCCEHQVFLDLRFILVRSAAPFHIIILTIVFIWGFLLKKLLINFTFSRVRSELCGHYPLRHETIAVHVHNKSELQP